MNIEKSSVTAQEYPYTVARISAMKAKLLAKDDYNKLLKMKENEIAKFLSDTEYKIQMNKYGISLSGANLVEMAIRDNLTYTLNKLKRISPDSLKYILDEYLKKEDIWNLKTIIRGKFTKTNNDEIRKLLVPVGSYNLDFLNKLLQENEIDKILNMSKMIKNEIVKTALKSFKDKKDLEVIEAALDTVFYKNLISYINTLPSELKLIKDFIASEIDALNIRIILKFKSEDIDDKTIKELMFISRSSKLPRDKWNKIIGIKNLDQIPKEFGQTPYETIVKDAVREFSANGTLSNLDLDFQKFLLKKANVKTHQNPLSADAIISYMFAKEIEIRNIYIIIKSKQLGLKEEFIQKELIA